MVLKDIAITALPNSKYSTLGFNFQTVCVEDLFLRNLIPYKNKHIDKLNILLVGLEDEEVHSFLKTGLSIGKFNNLLSTGEIFLEFDYRGYYQKNDYEKKLEVLNKILEGFNAFAIQTNSYLQPFKESYQKCLDQNLEDEYLYKEVMSKNNLYKVKVFIRVDLQSLEVIGVFQDEKGNDLSRKVFFARSPEALYHHYLGSVVWSSETEVTLYGRSKAEFWKIEL